MLTFSESEITPIVTDNARRRELEIEPLLSPTLDLNER